VDRIENHLSRKDRGTIPVLGKQSTMEALRYKIVNKIPVPWEQVNDYNAFFATQVVPSAIVVGLTRSKKDEDVLYYPSHYLHNVEKIMFATPQPGKDAYDISYFKFKSSFENIRTLVVGKLVSPLPNNWVTNLANLAPNLRELVIEDITSFMVHLLNKRPHREKLTMADIWEESAYDATPHLNLPQKLVKLDIPVYWHELIQELPDTIRSLRLSRVQGGTYVYGLDSAEEMRDRCSNWLLDQNLQYLQHLDTNAPLWFLHSALQEGAFGDLRSLTLTEFDPFNEEFSGMDNYIKALDFRRFDRLETLRFVENMHRFKNKTT